MMMAGLVVTSQAQAQIRLGVKGGMNLANVSGNLANEDIYQNKRGFHAGAVLNVGLIKNFLSVQPELLFSQKGFTYADKELTTNGLTSRYQGSCRYQYLDVPILLKVQAGGLYVEAGPQYAYLLSLKDEARVTTNGLQAVQSTALAIRDVNRNEIGYAVGIGFQAKSGLNLGVRYTGAFTDFAKKGYANTDMVNARNSVCQFSLGFLVPGR